MRQLSTALIFCLLVAGPATAQSEPLSGPLYEQTCEERNRGMQAYYTDREDAHMLSSRDDDPVDLILDDFLAGLSGDALIRVRLAIERDFISICAGEGGLSDITPNTVGAHFKVMMRHFEFDRSLPDWGLPDVPTLDFDVHSGEDWIRMNGTIPAKARLAPQNNIFAVALFKFTERSEIETQEELELVWDLGRLLAFDATEEEAKLPLAVALERIALKEGLRLKD